ncbi:MAG: magnesium transporter [Alphaproteobacteria bacterium]
MSETAPETERPAPPPEDLLPAPGIDPVAARTVEEELAAGNDEGVRAIIAPLHASDIADLIELLTPDARRRFIELIRDRFDPETLAYLDEGVRETVIGLLAPKEVAAALSELDSDDALDVIVDLDEDDRARILAELSPSDRAILEQALTYPEESAGRLMQREVVTVPIDWRVGDTIDYMRARAQHLPGDFYSIFVVDAQRRPVGVVPLSRLMRSRRPVAIADIVDGDVRAVHVDADQEEVALLFRQYGLVSAPVIDAEGRLVGVITVDDVVDVIHEEAEEDIMRLGGVQEDDFYEAIFDTTRARFTWLFVNLGTAILASAVIALFDTAIEKLVALAILMPIVASMGGNAGTQTLTVAVRALAMRELTPANALRIVGKEVLVGGINGILFAFIMGGVAWAWFGEPHIGGVIAAAMIANLLAAGLAGVAIPLALDRMGIDPAVASPVLLTTVTDVVGFFAFLGLASLLLL